MTQHSHSRSLIMRLSDQTHLSVSPQCCGTFHLHILLAILVAVCASSAQAQLYDTLWMREYQNGFSSLQFFPSGQSLIAVGFGTSGDSTKNYILDPNNGDIRSIFRADSRLYFLNNSDDTAIIMRRGNPYIVHVPTMSIIDSLEDDGNYTSGYSGKLSANSRYFFAPNNLNGNSKGVTCWDMATKRIIGTMPPIVYNPLIDSSTNWKLSDWSYSLVAPLPDGESFYVVLGKTFKHVFYPNKFYGESYLI